MCLASDFFETSNARPIQGKAFDHRIEEPLFTLESNVTVRFLIFRPSDGQPCGNRAQKTQSPGSALQPAHHLVDRAKRRANTVEIAGSKLAHHLTRRIVDYRYTEMINDAILVIEGVCLDGPCYLIRAESLHRKDP